MQMPRCHVRAVLGVEEIWAGVPRAGATRTSSRPEDPGKEPGQEVSDLSHLQSIMPACSFERSGGKNVLGRGTSR